MDQFMVYLKLGFEHIADFAGYDHMLFVITLCAFYSWRSWKKILVLVTAFTIGHSITLALSAFNIINIPQQLVETAIPITIFLTAIHNVVTKPDTGTKVIFHSNYFLALFFGFIHGMGFSNFFRALTGGESVVRELFAFNVGLEIGQIMIVSIFFTLYFLLDKIFTIKQRDWNLFISGAGAGVSLIMIIEALLGK
ncbi:MAG: HupE/UreJ family protein [Saprospiraceae bacterium]|nr:HupE/UreJ family protein [Saprospiraceae bacterium]